MSKHTPGPWVVDHANPNLVARDLDVYEYICQVAPSEFSESAHSYEQECANARLIAAAPDLLEALQMVRDYVVTMKGRGHDYQVVIDAAIAKATGEA